MNTTENILMTIAVFGSAVLITYILARYYYLVKKVIAENGGATNGGATNGGATNGGATNGGATRISYLELGCVVLSLGLGLVVSSLFTEMDVSEDTMDLLVWGTILGFGGLGLMLAQLVRNRTNAK